MRIFFSALVVAGLSFGVLFVGESHAQGKGDKEKASKIKALQTERDKLAKRLAQVDAELADLTRPEWTLDLAKMKKVPEIPAAGKVLGEYFKAEKVRLSPIGTLELEHGRSRMAIFLHLKVGQAIEGKSFEFSADDKQTGRRPSIHVHIHSEKASRPKMQVFSSDYAMRLEFGKEKENTLPGRLYLCLDDGGKSVIAGTFTLDLK